jgi:predicted acyltransferase
METAVKGKSPRLLSLDVLRGATMASMILVNDPGDWSHVYPPLDHSEWNGCTPTDLVFPFFLFMMGVSIVYAMEKRKEAVQDHGKLIWHAFKRMCTLLLINYGVHFFFKILDGSIHISDLIGSTLNVLSNMRLPGVLPRIAVVYFICTVIYLKTTAKTRVWLFVGALIGYWLMMTLIPVPGVGYANLNPETNLGAWLDRLVFGTKHLWQESKVWDPEGILGTLPAIGTGLFGIRVGTWLKRTDKDAATKVAWMFVFGIGAIVLALFWDFFFPINKKLWTSSFVLYTGGLATITLASLYWLIDVMNYKKATPFFVAFGMNSITAYVLADIVPGLMGAIKMTFHGQQTNLYGYLYQAAIVPFFTPINASLVAAIALVFIIWLFMWPLYKRNIIIKV